jgi:hypothetical protein
VNERFPCELKDRLFKGSNQMKLSQESREQLWICLVPILFGRHDFNPRGEGVEVVVLGHGAPFSAERNHVE